uniref:Uncharacterized protein n=1 Tax=Plectus sambesii TaxID=2011161 RepID=A0A914VAX6_9BILA
MKLAAGTMARSLAMGAKVSLEEQFDVDTITSADFLRDAQLIEVRKLFLLFLFNDLPRRLATRAVCRFCRHEKCLRAGMRPEAVQVERDAIGKRDNARTSSGDSPPSSVPLLADSTNIIHDPSSDNLFSLSSIGWSSLSHVMSTLQNAEQQVEAMCKDMVSLNEATYIGTTNEQSLVWQIV